MPKLLDLTGIRYGRLLVLERVKRYGKTYYTCACDCGNIKVICGTSLTGGNTSSCGCLRLEKVRKATVTHGMTGSKELKAWYHMHDRCYKESDPKYPLYGGRGIFVCERWHKDNGNGFINFFKDMGNKPSIKHTLHRINNDIGYRPDNCVWADYEEQNNNRRNSIKITIEGANYSKKEVANIFKVHVGSIERLQANRYTLDSIVQYLKSGERRNRDKKLLVKEI